MEPNTLKTKSNKSTSKFTNWFSRLFCLKQDNPVPVQIRKRSERLSISKQKQRISMSLLGTYKKSILCKISRKNFIVNSSQINFGRLPTSISKYLGDKLNAQTVIVEGQVSNKVTKRIPYILKLVAIGEKAVGECVQSDLVHLKTRVNDLCIYRPKFSPEEIPQFLEKDEFIAQKISIIANKYRNSMIILPKDTLLDEIGVMLSGVNKFIEVETIVANGATLCIVIYLGSKQFVLISQNQQLDFVAKQLNKDLPREDPAIHQLVRKIFQRSSMSQVLSLLMRSINQAIVDTIFSCFLRGALIKDLITNEQVCQLFPNRNNEVQLIQTPQLRMTARFNWTTSQNFKHSCSDDMLNGQNGQLIFQNQIETFYQTQISMQGLQIMGQYNPY